MEGPAAAVIREAGVAVAEAELAALAATERNLRRKTSWTCLSTWISRLPLSLMEDGKVSLLSSMELELERLTQRWNSQGHSQGLRRADEPCPR